MDEAVASWIAARSRDEVLDAFERAEAAIAPIYDARDLVSDPHLAAIGAFRTVEDAELGPLVMTDLVSRLSETPGGIEHPGGAHGQDTDAVFGALGVGSDELARLRQDGVV